MTRSAQHTGRLGAILLGALCALGALGGCQEGSTESRGVIFIDTVDISVGASDSRSGATVTVDPAPPGGGQSGVTPVAVTDTVNTTGQAVVPVEVTDDAVPANRYAGRIEIR